MTLELGKKIKTLREANQISIEELAERADVKADQLQQIENEGVEPSIGMLTKIVRVLGVRLGTLLDGEEDTGMVVSRDAERSKSMRFSGNEVSLSEHLNFFSLAEGKTDRHMEPFVIDINKGTESEAKLSSHEGEEFLYVIEGEIQLVYGKETVKLGKGDSVYYNSIIPHYVSSPNGPSRMLAVIYVPI